MTYQGARLYSQAEPDSECTVSGALALVLRASRLAGMAPLRLTRSRAHWQAAVSMPLAAGSILFMTAVNLVLMLGLILDFCEAPERRVRAGESALKAAIWIFDLLTVVMIANIAVYMGPARMRGLLKVLKELHQVNSDLKASPPSTTTEKRKSIAVVGLLSWSLVIQIADGYNIMQTTLKENKWWPIMCLYMPYYYADMLGVLVALQWGGAVLGARAAVAALNDRLRLLRHAKLETESGTTFEDLTRAPKPVNSLVDCFTTPGKARPQDVPMQASHVPGTLRRLALSYERITEVVRQMNEANGAILIVSLLSIFLRLVLTPYYLLLGLFDDGDVVVPLLVTQVNWSLLHLAKLLLMLEPCHWAHEQREQTEILLSKLMVHLSPACDRISNEVNQLAKQVQLSHAKFMPLGIYSLDRPLMATILGGVTTYLVIIIQFQKISVLL